MTTHKQTFGHVNSTNRNSYLNIICIKLVTQMKKKTEKKTKLRTFDLKFFFRFKTKNLKIGLFEIFRFFKNLKILVF